MPVTLKVNGKTTTVDVAPDTPLLWVLRDTLDLKGAKYGCGIAQCGACTVHIDGVASRSCNRPISEMGGAEVVTIEGLSADGGHPVQRAWVELDVAQCGYCQAGQIMSATRPTDADIDRGMNANICRCATYHRIRQAIHRAAQMAAADGNGNARRGEEDDAPKSLLSPAGR